MALPPPVRHLLQRALLPMVLVCASLDSSAAQPVSEQTWEVNLKEADIREFIDQVATITGRTFVVDRRVKGKVTVISSARLNQDAVYELFLSVLRVHNFAAVTTGNVTKVVLQNVVRQSSSPNDLGEPSATSEEFVTRVIAPENVASAELAKILRPMVPQHGHIAAVTTPNVVIVSDHAENLARLLDIVKRIDVADRDELVVVPLKEAWVGDIAELLIEIFPETASSAQPRRAKAITIIANERNNSLVLKGKSGKVAEVMEVVSQLDQPGTTGGKTQVLNLAHADAVAVAKIVTGILTGGGDGQPQSAAGGAAGATTIQADESLNALVVRADPGTMADIRELVDKLDVRRRQVLVEAAIVEVSLNDSRAFGIDMAAADRSGTTPVMATALGSALGGVLSSLAGTGTDDAVVEDAALLTAVGSATQSTFAVGKIKPNAFSYVALIQALSSNSEANLLSTPSILTLDNEEARIVVGQNVPFRTGSFTTNTNGSTNPFTTITRQDVGLTLVVTPHVHDGNAVRLEIRQEVSNVVNSAIGDAGFADIVTSQRTIETTILADDQQTIVLGGLIQDDVNATDRRVPLLGDLPLLGRLFRNNSRSRVKRNLLVFLRPTVLRNAADVVDVTRERYRTIWEVGADSRPGRSADVDALYQGGARTDSQQPSAAAPGGTAGTPGGAPQGSGRQAAPQPPTP